MTNTNSYRSIESIRLEAELTLAEWLFENQIITESEYKVGYLNTSSQALLESVVVSENVEFNDPPEFWYGSGKDKIHYDVFRRMLNNIEEFRTVDYMWISHHGRQPPSTNSGRNWVDNACRAFLKNIGKARTELLYHSTKERNAAVKERVGPEGDDYPPEASVDGGSRRKVSRTANIERASQLFSGDIYNDQSRIPKRRWGAWWKRWISSRQHVQDDSSTLAIVKWTKHFIMGYAIDRSVFFEIWYNSYDGTFSVHDRYGNFARQGERIPVMRDALNLLFHNVAEYSPQDAEIIRNHSPNLRRVNQDIANYAQGIVSGAENEADRMRSQKERLNQAKQAEEEKQAMRAADRIAKDEERRRKAASRKARSDKIKGAAASSAKAAGIAAEQVFKWGTWAAKKLSPILSRYNRFSERMNSHSANYKQAYEDAQRDQRRQGGDFDQSAYRKFWEEQARKADQAQRRYDQQRQRFKDRAKDIEEEIYTLQNATIESEEEKKSTERKILKLENKMSQMEKEWKEVEEYTEEDLKKLKKEFSQMGTQRRFYDKDSATKAQQADAVTMRKPRTPEATPTGRRQYDPADEFGPEKARDRRRAERLLRQQQNRANTPDVIQLPFAESVNLPNDEEVDLEDYSGHPLYLDRINSQVDDIRKNAETSNYTRQVVNNMFLDGFIKSYDQTRVRQRGALQRALERFFRLFRGRSEPIALPTKVASRRRRLRGFFAGTKARADFIIGYSISEKVNFEIWYVQEISSDAKRQLSSFYVYDVTADRVVEGNLPHYRNAILALMTKIGSDTKDD